MDKFSPGDIVKYRERVYFFDSYINTDEALICLIDEDVDLFAEEVPKFIYAKVRIINLKHYER